MRKQCRKTSHGYRKALDDRQSGALWCDEWMTTGQLDWCSVYLPDSRRLIKTKIDPQLVGGINGTSRDRFSQIGNWSDHMPRSIVPWDFVISKFYYTFWKINIVKLHCRNALNMRYTLLVGYIDYDTILCGIWSSSANIYIYVIISFVFLHDISSWKLWLYHSIMYYHRCINIV